MTTSSVQPSADAQHTVAELLQAYERDYLPDLAPDTAHNARGFFRRFGQEFGALPLAALTPTWFKGWRDTLRQRYSTGTVRTYGLLLSGALKAAVDDYGWIPMHPLKGVRKPPASPARVRFLSTDERLRLLAACQQSRNPLLYFLVVLAISTGARKNELRRLRWCDIDLERGYLRLVKTKNKEPRAVPVTGHAFALLCQRAGLPHTDTDWVFPSRQRQQPMHFEKAWQNVRKQAGLTHFRFHDLRHTAASYLAMSGATLLDIATVLGHKQISTTLRYAHLTAAHTHRIAAQMTAHVFGEGDRA